jgi:hypothetical protein
MDEPVKVSLWGNVRKVLGFVVHEHGIQIDPKKIESIGKIGNQCARRMPKSCWVI